MFARIKFIAVLVPPSALLILALLTGAGCPGGSTSDNTSNNATLHGQVTVNIIDAVNGETTPGTPTAWAQLVTLGERTYPMNTATKSSDSHGLFINADFRAPGADNNYFEWHGYVPSISAGASVSAQPAGFVGSLDLRVPYGSSDSHSSFLFTSYDGTITIKEVSGNLITFEATAKMKWVPGDGFYHDPPGSLGYIDVTVSGSTTLVDQ